MGGSLLIVFAFVGAISVGQVRAQFAEALAAFDAAKIDYRFKLTVPESYKESVRLEKDFVATVLRDRSVMDQVRGAAKASGGTVELPTSYDGVVQYFSSQLERGLEIERQAEYSIQRGERWQIDRWDPLSSHDATPAERSEKQVLQYGSHAAIPSDAAVWLCLEPTTIAGRPHAWSKSSITLSGLLPPFFAHESISSLTMVSLEELWAPGDVHGLLLNSSAPRPVLMVYRRWGNGFLVAAYVDEQPRSAFPLWVAECFTYDPESQEFQRGIAENLPPTPAELRSVKAAIDSFLSGRPFSALNGLIPRQVMTFVDFFSPSEQVTYPKLVEHYELGRVRDRASATSDAHQRPFGPLTYAKAEIQDIVLRPKLLALQPLQLPPGVSMLDRDREEASIIGEMGDALDPRNPMRFMSRLVVIVVNFAILILGAVWLLRRRSRQLKRGD